MTDLAGITSRLRDLPIGQKLMLIVAITLLSVMTMSMTVFFVHEFYAFHQSEIEYRQSLAKIVGRNTTAAIKLNDRTDAKETLEGLAEDPHILSAWVVLNSGEVFASYVKLPGKEDLRTIQIGDKRMIAPGALAHKDRWLGFAKIKVVYPFVIGGEKISTIVLISDTAALQERFWIYLALSLSLVSLSMGMAYAITSRLQRTITDPLDELVKITQQVKLTRDYTVRANYVGRDEIGALTQGFNRMLQEVENHDQQLIRYQDRLADIIALRTEELHKVKEEAEAAALNKTVSVERASVTGTQMSAKQVRGSEPVNGNSRRKLFALMSCIDAKVLFLEEGGDRVRANRAAAISLRIDLATCLDQNAFAEGFEVYTCDIRAMHSDISRSFLDLQGKSVRQMEVMLLGSDETHHYELINAEPFRNDVGTAMGTVFVVRDITLQKEEDIMRHSARRLIESEERMRRNLAAELHDEVGRDLTALHLNSEIINSSMPAELREQLGERIGIVHGLLEDLGCKIANIISELRPPMLDDFGLKTALKWLAGIVSIRHDITVDLLVVDDLARFGTERETAIFRVAQEAVNNAAKHSGATVITVVLEEIGDRIRIMICDDGKGFDPQAYQDPAKRQSWGLLIMRERAESIGGTFSIDSVPGEGTTIIVEIGRD